MHASAMGPAVPRPNFFVPHVAGSSKNITLLDASISAQDSIDEECNSSCLTETSRLSLCTSVLNIVAQLYPRERLFFSKPSAQALRDIIERIEPFYMASTQDVEAFDLDGDSVGQYLSHIQRALQKLILVQQGRKRGDLMETLENFVSFAHSRLADQSIERPSSLSSLRSELPQIFPSTASFRRYQDFPTVEVARPDNKCPLKHAIEMAQIMGPGVDVPDKLPLETFLQWAVEQGIQSAVHTEIGTLQSISHYRETKSLLHHEFVIAGFGYSRVPTSWVRMERAARSRLWRRGSMGPLFGGAPLREDVSFHLSKEKLRGDKPNAELTSVRIDGATSRVLLHEFAQQVSNTSNAFPLYTLLEANCRYFARRTTLGLAQLFPESVTGYAWMGSQCTLSTLREELHSDRHGGKTLTKGESLSVEHANTLARATTLLSLGEEFVVGLLCDDVIDSLGKLEKPTQHHLYLIASAQLITAEANIYRGDYDDALKNLATRSTLTTKTHFGSQQSRALYLDMLEREAEVHVLKDSPKEALSLLRHANHCRSKLHKEFDDTLSAISLAKSMALRANCLLLLPDCIPEAVVLAREASDIGRKAYAQRPILVRGQFAMVLNTLAHASSESGLLSDAYDLSREASSLLCESLQWHSYATRVDYASSLQHQAKYAADMKLYTEACSVGELAVKHWRLLYAQMPSNYWKGLVTTQWDLSSYLSSKGDISGAQDVMADNVDILRELYTKDAAHRDELVRGLKRYTDFLDEHDIIPTSHRTDPSYLRREAKSPKSLFKHSKSDSSDSSASGSSPSDSETGSSDSGDGSDAGSENGPRRPRSPSSDDGSGSGSGSVHTTSDSDDEDDGEWETEEEELS